MTEADGVGSPRDRAVARVRDLLEDPLREATDAGYMIVVPAAEIVTTVEREIGEAALRLPRYYPQDEGKAWLLGVGRTVDPDTGQPRNMYARWRSLPNGRLHVQIVEAGSAGEAAGVGGLDLAEFLGAPDALPHVLRALLAGCEFAAANAAANAAASSGEGSA